MKIAAIGKFSSSGVVQKFIPDDGLLHCSSSSRPGLTWARGDGPGDFLDALWGFLINFPGANERLITMTSHALLSLEINDRFLLSFLGTVSWW